MGLFGGEKKAAGGDGGGGGAVGPPEDVRVVEARKLLSQIYYRQNMYVLAAQNFDAVDLVNFLIPSVICTGMASFMGFAATSSLVDRDPTLRNFVSLSCGMLGVLATVITALRNASKFDVKAEMFRGAAGQYRLLATRIEHRIRQHTLQTPEERLADVPFWTQFFDEQVDIVLTCQSEMKYFPPNAVVKEWIKAGKMQPNPIDQPGSLTLTVNEMLGVEAADKKTV